MGVRAGRLRALVALGLTLALAAVAAVALVAGRVPGADASSLSRTDAARAVLTTGQRAWVTRSGSRLLLRGAPWRFSGVDMYWLGLDDNVRDAQGPTWPTREQIDDGFAGAQALGARVVRAHTLGISVGCARCLEPQRGVFDDAAFRPIDDAVASARAHGLRLMVPLTDEWHYYHGGKHTFTAWRGYPDDPAQTAATSDAQRQAEAHFYTDPAVEADFHDYVRHLLTHVDPQTGRRLADDSTIAVWETGNELWDAPVDWTERTAAFVKSLAPHALVADGSAATGKHVADAGVLAPDVDVLGGHFYPQDLAWARQDAAVAAAAGKAYVVGEYPLTGALAPFADGLLADGDVTGDLAWTLLPHLADGSPEPHGDGYAFHVPGATAAETAEVALLTAHAAAMRTAGAVASAGAVVSAGTVAPAQRAALAVPVAKATTLLR